MAKNKKIIVTTLIIFLLVMAAGYLYVSNKNMLANSLANKCRNSGGGWAPAFFAGNEGPPDSNGNPITQGSPLVDYDGYTCHCHTENTGWNGNACVPIGQ